MSSSRELIKALMKLKNSKKAKWTAPYIGLKPGGYGENDKLLGITVPIIRKTTNPFTGLSLAELSNLIDSEYHEIRFAAVVIIVEKYKKTKDEKIMKRLYQFYVDQVNKIKINNWDLVDVSAPTVTGHYLFNKHKNGQTTLIEFAKSNNIWSRRVAVISTFYHIRQNEFESTLLLAELLLKDEHDLIHKAVGWMLREIGKRDVDVLKEFLDKHHSVMPRVMLRYSIEKFSKTERKHYLGK